MRKREVHIVSYFSLPTDLAASMRDWPEFRSGEEYSVDLRSDEGQDVTVRLELDEDKYIGKYVAVAGVGEGHLFDRVLGRVVHELGAHSDNLMIYRWDR